MSHPRLVFLDIDGVLNTREDYELLRQLMLGEGIDGPALRTRLDGVMSSFKRRDDRWGDFVNVSALERLQALIRDVDAKVVGISSWFITKTVEEVAEFLAIPIVGKTQYCGGGELRAAAVRQYLKENRPEHALILDDQPFGYAEAGLSAIHLIPSNGIGSDDVLRAKVLWQRSSSFLQTILC